MKPKDSKPSTPNIIAPTPGDGYTNLGSVKGGGKKPDIVQTLPPPKPVPHPKKD